MLKVWKAPAYLQTQETEKLSGFNSKVIVDIHTILSLS